MAAFASTNLGDVSPNILGPKCEFTGGECSAEYTCPGKNEMCFASGPGRDMFESTRIIAHRIFDEAVVRGTLTKKTIFLKNHPSNINSKIILKRKISFRIDLPR